MGVEKKMFGLPKDFVYAPVGIFVKEKIADLERDFGFFEWEEKWEKEFEEVVLLEPVVKLGEVCQFGIRNSFPNDFLNLLLVVLVPHFFCLLNPVDQNKFIKYFYEFVRD